MGSHVERMHFFKMKGAYNGLMAMMYNVFVAEGVGRLYDLLVESFFDVSPPIGAWCRRSPRPSPPRISGASSGGRGSRLMKPNNC